MEHWGQLEYPLHLPRACMWTPTFPGAGVKPRPGGDVSPPLKIPGVFGGQSHLQTQGWAVGDAHDRSRQRLPLQHGWDGERDPGLGEATPACPLQLLGQPEPIHSFATGERSPRPRCMGLRDGGCLGRGNGFGLIRGAPLCGRRLLSAPELIMFCNLSGRRDAAGFDGAN